MMTKPDKEELQRLNDMKLQLQKDIEAYNLYSRPVLELRLRLNTTGKSDANENNTSELTDQLNDMKQKLKSKEVINLKHNIDEQTKVIQALEKKLFGDANPSSPSFLKPR